MNAMNLKMLVICLLLFPAPVFAQRGKMPDNWADGYVYANGIRLHYYRASPQPGKPVIVMAHGASDNGLCWTTLTWKLQDDYDIYMLDLRGHGLSDPFTAQDNSETLVNDLVGFVKAMKFEKPILMGHSLGAATVMRVGAEHPGVGRAIIMLDPSLRNRTAAPAPAARDVPNRALQAQPAVPSQANSDRLSISMFGNPETLVAQNNISFEELVAAGRKQNPLWDNVDIEYWALSKKQYHGPYHAGGSEAMRGLMNIGNSLSKIEVPAIILKADAPEEVRKNNEQAAAALPKGKIIHIDGAGHNLHHDKLERTTQVLKEFLSTL